MKACHVIDCKSTGVADLMSRPGLLDQGRGLSGGEKREKKTRGGGVAYPLWLQNSNRKYVAPRRYAPNEGSLELGRGKERWGK